MPRRNRPERRVVPPDVRYGSVHVQEFINRMMMHGKKSTATRIMYDAFDIIHERTNRDPLDVFDQAIRNISPVLEVRPRRVGGSTYQVPVEVVPERRLSLAMRWLLAATRSRSARSMAEKLAAELLDASNNTGAAMKKREEVHRIAESNRAFAHYRW